MSNQIDIQEVQDYIGEWNGEKCHECGSDTLEDKKGTKWCSFVECDWSNEPSFSAWLRSIGKKSIRPTTNAVDPATPRGERLSDDEWQRRMNEQMFNTPGN